MQNLDDRRAVFGRAVRRLRQEREMSQEAVELAGGLARSQLSAIERREKDVQLSTLLRVADGLGVPLSEVVARYEELLDGG